MSNAANYPIQQTANTKEQRLPMETQENIESVQQAKLNKRNGSFTMMH